ncbi:hypothetical protein CMQ_7085 [Grosmannia clavigera kw1407]|uniref:CENP-V/GFA domain-containing protein n=1 Tax=Grosmannia clavigera (strain kw1407 / UAMH 11150) TaxID=655863 RepID=F0XPY9_GROCL|nr:uncharacterized protein CMQ_7085 [Grosmannia clavigera kw1407]EFX00083.1 hypothetical protein CMQ_7085 [Grosmannia clavigera kw1407]
MSRHAIRGGCRCGRNHYIVQPPPDATEAARVLFAPEEAHRSSLASPLPAFLRVPLSWYHSSTTSFYDDETPAMIHRVYEQASPGTVFSQRRFCGFCGTPLSFWSEAPRLEADYIRLALGSLYAQDLNQLDDWGAVIEGGEESDEQDEQDGQDQSPSTSTSSSTGLPWLDRFVEGSRLDRQLLLQQKSQRISAARIHRHDVGSATRPDGSVVEWEVVEWTEGDEDNSDVADDKTVQGHASPAKRQKQDDGTVPV